MLVESGLGDCSSSQKVTWDSCVLRSSASDAEKRVFCTNQEFHLIVTVHSFSRDPRHEAGASHSNKKQENNPEVFKTGMAHQTKSVAERGKILDHQHPSPAPGSVHSEKGLWAVLASLPGRDRSSVLPTSHLASESQHILSQMLVRLAGGGWWEASSFCKNYRTDMVLYFILAQYTQHLQECSFTNRAKRSAGATPCPWVCRRGFAPLLLGTVIPVTFPRQFHMKVDSKEPCKIKDYLKEIKQVSLHMPIKAQILRK